MNEDAERDIQALVAAGFGALTQAEYLLLTVSDPARARRWLRRLLDAGLVASITNVGRERDKRMPQVATVAMSFAGMTAAGLQASETHPFPSVFSRGMADAAHARTLGDDNLDDWAWSDVDGRGHVAHWLVAHFRQAGTAGHALFDDAELHAAGFAVHRVLGDPGFFQSDGTAVEPFGFRDGLAQPDIDGLRGGRSSRRQRMAQAAHPAASDHIVAAGEFVLGHPNEYGQDAYAPDVAGWSGRSGRFAANGSYLAVRQIRQDVAAFEKFVEDHPLPAPSPTIGELMFGRRRDGTPLAGPVANGDLDLFRYRMHDMEGFGCPRGAHVRRANPRDTLAHDIASGIESSKLHRLLRRGRSYRSGDGAQQGMFFVALNADLERQFAFVQQQWITNTGFGDLSNEPDPVLGPAQRSFTVQRQDLSLTLKRLPQFTWVVGGGYFLLPSLAALNYVADLPY